MKVDDRIKSERLMPTAAESSAMTGRSRLRSTEGDDVLAHIATRRIERYEASHRSGRAEETRSDERESLRTIRSHKKTDADEKRLFVLFFS